MKLIHRMAYFLVGLSVGIFFLIFFFNAKGTRCNYMPNARVLNDLSRKPFHYSDSASVVLAETWIDTADIKKSLQYGDVDFSRSKQPVGNGKLYVVEGQTKDEVLIDIFLINYADRVILQNVKRRK